ncbi:MAG: hypothetical protein C0483_15270 [Pirellula sp.]|nr:hypothetical protein [Pirellula sp.]
MDERFGNFWATSGVLQSADRPTMYVRSGDHYSHGTTSMPNALQGDDARRIQRTVLSDVRIAGPCEIAWDAMTGTDRERHCASCNKKVHNLIEHTTDEAYRLVMEPDSHICIRVHRDDAGNVITKDSCVEPGSTRRSVLQRWALLAASWLGLSTGVGCDRVKNKLYPVVQGDVCPPPRSSTLPTGHGTGKHYILTGGMQPMLRPQASATTSLMPK